MKIQTNKQTNKQTKHLSTLHNTISNTESNLQPCDLHSSHTECKNMLSNVYFYQYLFTCLFIYLFIHYYFQLTQDVIWTLVQRFLNVMDVRWTSKQRRVLTGNDYYLYALAQIQQKTILYRNLEVITKNHVSLDQWIAIILHH